MAWPPPGHWNLRTHWESWAAWWSGDTHRLAAHTYHTAPGGYWDRRRKKPDQTRYHLPLAGDMARTAAELMYGDTPKLTFDTKDVQTAWDDLAEEIGWSNVLLESGEVGAALGGSFLRPGWDADTADHPLPMVVRADLALPEFRFGRLAAVTFVTELAPPNDWTKRNQGEHWRWLEHHEPGQIRHELWLGTATTVGDPRPLTDHPHTQLLDPLINTTAFRPTGILVEYIPNNLPQPLDVLPLGRSVFQGCETLLDALDEVWDSWMRDIRLAKGRLFIAKEMVQPVGTGGVGAIFRRGQPAQAFDLDAEAYVLTETSAEGENGKPNPITDVQLAIRLAEHEGTAAALIEQIISRCGFDPQTFGLHVEGQQSGTALRIRNQRSYRTTDRAHGYAKSAVARFAETLMLVNKVVFGGPAPADRPKLEWREPQLDPKDAAEIAELLNRAQAASLKTIVGLLHPDWAEEQVDEEVALIKGDQPVAPDLTGLTGFEPLTDNSGQPPTDPTQNPAAPPPVKPPTPPKP